MPAGGVIPIEVARVDRPSQMPNSSHANHATADTPGPTSPVNRELPDSPVPAGSAVLPKIGPSIENGPALSFTTSTATISSSDPDPSEFDFTSSFLGRLGDNGLGFTPAAAAQARSSLAGAILQGSTAYAATTGAPATTTPTIAHAAAPPAAGAATTLAAAVGQSLGNGIRPMTMPPAKTGTPGAGGRHSLGSISPDTGSGGVGPPNGTPPALNSMTFGIQMTAPGQYQATSTVPVSAVAGLTASLPGTTGWSWSNTVTSYVGYFSAEAGSPAPVNQAPVTRPSRILTVMGSSSVQRATSSTQSVARQLTRTGRAQRH